MQRLGAKPEGEERGLLFGDGLGLLGEAVGLGTAHVPLSAPCSHRESAGSLVGPSLGRP